MNYYITVFFRFITEDDDSLSGNITLPMKDKYFDKETYDEVVRFYVTSMESHIKKHIKRVETITSEEYEKIQGEEKQIDVDFR